jgi:hypothetical protein
MECGWNRHRRHRPAYRVNVVGFRDNSRLDNGLGQLLNKERRAIGAINNLVDDFLGQRFAAGHMANDINALFGRQPAEAEEAHVRTGDPWQRKLWSKADDHQNPSRRTQSMSRSSDSRVVGSLQCTSSHTISTGCCSASPSSCVNCS